MDLSRGLGDVYKRQSFNRVYMECFGSHRPARSTTEARLMIDAKVEIDVTAYKPLAAK
jgi:enamine deaminase RidA (YjgF/YER057c/UK114 family)